MARTELVTTPTGEFLHADSLPDGRRVQRHTQSSQGPAGVEDDQKSGTLSKLGFEVIGLRRFRERLNQGVPLSSVAKASNCIF